MGLSNTHLTKLAMHPGLFMKRMAQQVGKDIGSSPKNLKPTSNVVKDVSDEALIKKLTALLKGHENTASSKHVNFET